LWNFIKLTFDKQETNLKTETINEILESETNSLCSEISEKMEPQDYQKKNTSTEKTPIEETLTENFQPLNS
jgi:hypothetical protein